MRKGQTTLSVAVNHEIKERFQDLFEQSQSNSKGDFLNQILDDYENFDPQEIAALRQHKASSVGVGENLAFFENTLQQFVDAGKVQVGRKAYKVNNHHEALTGLLLACREQNLI